jgi:hypothetical protein
MCLNYPLINLQKLRKKKDFFFHCKKRKYSLKSNLLNVLLARADAVLAEMKVFFRNVNRVTPVPDLFSYYFLQPILVLLVENKKNFLL